MKLTIPELSLVVLIGPSGSGKSTFARSHFKTTEVLSSDFCRGLVSDDENDQHATNDAFEVLHFVAAKRLAAGKLTVVDATNVQLEDRKPLLALAREYHFMPVAIVFNLPEQIPSIHPSRLMKPISSASHCGITSSKNTDHSISLVMCMAASTNCKSYSSSLVMRLRRKEKASLIFG